MKKTTKIIIGAMAVSGLMFVNACKKDPGPGGKAHIHGHVEIESTETPVPNATVEIWYDATSSTGEANDKTTTMSMSGMEGKFEFENLRKGDYYVQCMYTDTLGVMLKGGSAVTIDKKTGEFDADIHLE